MDEVKLSSGQRQPEQATRALVAVRTLDRRILVSPTQEHPDFFDVALSRGGPSIESKVVGTISSEYGIVVNNDQALKKVSGEPTTLGWATYLRHTRDYTRAETIGHFPVHTIQEYQAVLSSTSEDETESDAVRREAHIKAELFKQVITLFR